ncbi:Uridylate kinase [Labeo rohita]|uniref:Uridylate kinase n=1 Tax=Labeo rohita TaxID=84645 RepID=A0ABQ8L6B8_LABRO|nr:Uridylate kinase [Labeo rohita]
MCVVRLGVEHAASALEGADCPHCELFPLRMLHSGKALFEEEAFTSIPQGVGSISGKVAQLLHSWGLQLNLWREWRRETPYLLPHPKEPWPVLWDRKPALQLLPPNGTGSSLHRLSSEEGTWRARELLEVVTCAVPKLNIDWPAEEKAAPQKSKLDERFLQTCLFIAASDYYGNVAGLDERAYKTMPQLEQTLANYLSPGMALSLKAPTLPSKPLCTASALVGKGYMAAGQTGACLHAMSVLQAYQADLLKDIDEGEKVDLSELRRTADLALRATKETAQPLLEPSGLFGDAVDSVVSRYQEARKQARAFQQFLPHCSLVPADAGREQSQPCTSSYCFVASTNLPQAGWGPAGPSYLDFAPGMTKAFLYPRAGNLTSSSIICMCPVRALDAYIHRAALWRKSDQLFVCSHVSTWTRKVQ